MSASGTVEITARALGVELLSETRKRRELLERKRRAEHALRPYLVRDAGAGYVAELYWTRPDVAHVLIVRDGRTVDTLSVAPADALARFYHPALYSAAYRAELTAPREVSA